MTEYELLHGMASKIFRYYCELYLPYGFAWVDQEDLDKVAMWYEYKWYQQKSLEYWYDID